MKKECTREEFNAYHRAYAKKRYPEYKKMGICCNCKKNKATKGHTCCEKCAVEKRMRTNFLKTPKNILVYSCLLEKQKGRCAICGESPKKLLIDHKHGTDKIRGLLCHSCNVGIGLFKERETLFKKAIKYISQ